jgi:hypothetical protein
MNAKVAKITGILIVAMMALGACGSGSDGSAQSPSLPTDGDPFAGITRTGVAVAVGPVTAFGSVVVNGITYDTSAAEITVDGQLATQADLAVGDMVLVIGTIDDDNTNAVAESVEFDDNVEGPVTSVDTGTEVMVVLGQTVRFGGAIFDDNCPADLNDLATVIVAAVEVSGQVMGDGTIDATRIECKAELDEAEITATVTTAAPGATTFEIGALTVDFSGVLMLENFPGARSIEAGDLVEVKGSVGSPTLLNATSVEFKGDRLVGDDGDHIEIQGFITSFDSPLDFVVSNVTMVACDIAAGCTVTTEGMPGGTLGLDLKVEVEGEFVGTDLVATSVDIRLGNAVRVTALVDNVNLNSIGNAESLVLLGITFNVDQGKRTRFEDKSGQPTEASEISQINIGDYVAVRGQQDGTGGLFAVIVELEELKPADPLTVFDTIIQGFLQAEPGTQAFPPLFILDVIVESNAATIFEDELDDPILPASNFFDAILAGNLIKAKGTQVTVTSGDPDMPDVVTLLAEEIEIQVE